MAEIANRLRNLTDEAFDEERAYDGTPWARLDDATIRAKGSERILWDEGILRDSLSARSTRTAATVGVGATSGEEEFPYGAAHQFGTRHLPERPFLPLDGEELPDDLLHELAERVREYFHLE
jgi:phage gpG-like protein